MSLCTSVIQEIREEAARQIEVRGHCHGQFIDADGRICAQAALALAGGSRVIMASNGVQMHFSELAYRASAHVQREVGCSLVVYNDTHTKEEVIAALRGRHA